MKIPHPTTIDFEGFKIEGRPKYPPVPIGVSIKYWGKKAQYYAFGHREGNTHCYIEAKNALELAYKTKDGILFQNSKFDVDIAEVFFNLKVPQWQRIHDTMFLLFLDDPHQKSLGLKESAERLLNWPAEEKDEVAQWLLDNQPVPGIKISTAKNSDYYFMKYLALVPAKIVGKYANGDVERTEALFKLLYEKNFNRGMQEPYDRERRLMPCLLDMERQGVPVDLKKLRDDVALYSDWREKINEWVIKKLKTDPKINLNSGAQLFDAMLTAGFVDESKALLTPTGKYQTNKDALLLAVTNKHLLTVLQYRSQLNTFLNTFMNPWLKTAEQSGGLIYTDYNQVKSPKGDSTGGARTGRLSSSPNFQNIPNAVLYKQKDFPTALKSLPQLPIVRGYIIPFKGDVLIDRDYSQQEPRILAHFDGGAILEKYASDPWMDFHDSTQHELLLFGLNYGRKPVKIINLGNIYGMGIGLLAAKTGLSIKETKNLKKLIMKLYPGLDGMYKEMKLRYRENLPIRTWGGREYYCEPAKIVNGRIQHYDYKMVNVLIQGSAADATKEAIILFYGIKKPSWKLILNVHDQLTSSVPKREMKKAMEAKRKVMESLDFDVPMLSEGKISNTNWDELRDYDKKGVLKYGEA